MFDLLEQGGRSVVEEQVSFVKEEDEFRFVRVAHFGELLEQFRQEPEQEGGVEFRAVDQLRGVEHVDIAAAILRRAHQV